MLKIYDKAQWHIDGGEDKISVVDKLKIILYFLLDKGLLSSEGKEIVNFGVDSSISIHERMLTQEGKKFLDEYYDKAIGKSKKEIIAVLEKDFDDFRLQFENGLKNDC